jgi:predicted N-formylglutamate amidohydrolase
MNHLEHTHKNDVVTVLNAECRSPVVVVCEHASCFIPPALNDLGVSVDSLQSHAVWDPGALAVAKGLSDRLNAKLVASRVSRLVYDCNRPPSAPDAMPHQSEAIKVPGNVGLTAAQRQDRVDEFYEPFRTALAEAIAATSTPVIVTIHSFTPTYHGKKRSVEIGVLHDTDARLADVMLETASQFTRALVLRNDPYGPEHGVTHTLKEHALANGYLNVMLEVRNDLIQDTQQQDDMADCIANWLEDALGRLSVEGAVICQV